MPKRIAIMQPTYLPWLGYLAMIEKVDQFVFLDNVQFDHRSWQQRNRIKTDRGELWLTIAVKKKGLFDQRINQVICVDLTTDVRKHLKCLSHSYSKSKFYKEFYKDLCDFTEKAIVESQGYLGHFSISMIKFLCNYVGINKEFVLASQIDVGGSKDELLANLCEHLGGDSYLSPPGSKDYLEGSEAFKDKNIEILYHSYVHPHYSQLYGEFLGGMSCLDAFFNVERDQLKPLIMSGCR